MPLYQKIGKNIELARKNACINQSTLAKRLNLSRSSVSNMEVGRHKVKLETLIQIGEVTGTDLSTLLVNVDIKQNDYQYKTPEILLKKLDKIPNDKLKAFLVLVQ